MAASNLSLGNLYKAWNGTTRSGLVSSSLNAANALAGTPVSMSSFIYGNVAVTQPFTYIVESTSENLTFAFTGQGLAFDNRVKIQAANYSVTVNDSTYFTIGTNGATTSISAKALAASVLSGSNATTLTAYYDDGYTTNGTGNRGAGNASTKTIYSVDSYNSINSDVLCVSTDTDILLADGSTVKAGDLYAGDMIKTFVPTDMPEWFPTNDEGEWYWWYNTTGSNGEIVNAEVSNIYFSFADSYVSINDGAIKSTHAHPFFVWDALTETYQFTRAEDVVEGDKLVKYNAATGLVEDVLVELVQFVNKTLEIATITVDSAHTYLANGFVSHNKGAATAPIPWTNLVCYLEPQFAASYNTAVSTTNFNDVAGYSTGFNLTGGTSNPAIVAPTFNGTSPKSLTFASGKYGIKEQAYSSGTGNANFNTTSGNGYTIIAFVNASGGNILSRGTDYTLNASSTTIAFTSTPNGNTSATGQTLTGWRMIAVTTGAGTTKIYNNNSEVASASTTAAATTGTSDIYLMQNNTGNLGSFFFYQRALTATEIGNVWNNLKGRYGL
jgi:hypothetical protein